jgi:hypothetical protein
MNKTRQALIKEIFDKLEYESKYTPLFLHRLQDIKKEMLNTKKSSCGKCARHSLGIHDNQIPNHSRACPKLNTD